MIGIYETVLPSQVSDEMSQLLAWYNNQDISLEYLPNSMPAMKVFTHFRTEMDEPGV